jgi:hypothetical protein
MRDTFYVKERTHNAGCDKSRGFPKWCFWLIRSGGNLALNYYFGMGRNQDT